MKKGIPLFVLALAMIFSPASALAGEAINELKGSWLAESFNGEAPPQGVKMVLTFVDDDTLTMEVTFGGETKKEEVKYKATKDGKMTVYPKKKPEGESSTWKVKDGKLTIEAENGDKMILKRTA